MASTDLTWWDAAEWKYGVKLKQALAASVERLASPKCNYGHLCQGSMVQIMHKKISLK